MAGKRVAQGRRVEGEPLNRKIARNQRVEVHEHWSMLSYDRSRKPFEPYCRNHFKRVR